MDKGLYDNFTSVQGGSNPSNFLNLYATEG